MMFSLLNLFTRTRERKPRTAPRPTTRLWLERLEARDCPTAPVLSMSLSMNGLRSVTLCGSVADTNPAGLTVTFTGVVTATTTTDTTGHFNLTTNASSLGNVQGTTVDRDGLASNTATVTVSCPSPLIVEFACTQNSGVITLSGRVIHPDQYGMQVTIQGAPQSLQPPVIVTADANGYFSYSFVAKPNDVGSVWASCVDCWGQLSNVAQTYVLRQAA